MLDDYDWEAIEPSGTNPRASVRWSSREVNLGDSAVIQSDMWSWACVVLQLITGDIPYSSIQTDEHLKLVMSFGKRGFVTPEAFHELDEIPTTVMRLLRRCWEFDLSQRPNARKCIDTLNSMLNADPDANQAHNASKQRPSREDVSPQKHLRIDGAGSDEQATRVRFLASASSSRELLLFKRFERETDTGRDLEHPFALKFVGTHSHEAHLFFLNPLAKNGAVWECISDRPDINRVRLLCETSDADPKQTLPADGQRTTRSAKLCPLGPLVVIK